MQFDNIDDYNWYNDEIRQIGWERSDVYFKDLDYEDEVYELYENPKIGRTKYINNRYTDAEFAEISEMAQIAGISRSAFVRKRALGHKIIANNDLVILRELRRIGGLIKHLYSQGNKSEEMDNTWKMLQSLFKTISDNFNKEHLP